MTSPCSCHFHVSNFTRLNLSSIDIFPFRDLRRRYHIHLQRTLSSIARTKQAACLQRRLYGGRTRSSRRVDHIRAAKSDAEYERCELIFYAEYGAKDKTPQLVERKYSMSGALHGGSRYACSTRNQSNMLDVRNETDVLIRNAEIDILGPSECDRCNLRNGKQDSSPSRGYDY